MFNSIPLHRVATLLSSNFYFSYALREELQLYEQMEGCIVLRASYEVIRSLSLGHIPMLDSLGDWSLR